MIEIKIEYKPNGGVGDHVQNQHPTEQCRQAAEQLKETHDELDFKVHQCQVEEYFGPVLDPKLSIDV